MCICAPSTDRPYAVVVCTNIVWELKLFIFPLMIARFKVSRDSLVSRTGVGSELLTQWYVYFLCRFEHSVSIHSPTGFAF